MTRTNRLGIPYVAIAEANTKMLNAPLRTVTEAYKLKELGNHKEALKLFVQGLDSDFTVATASFELAQYYEGGHIVPQDFKLAFEYYLVAAENNIAEAQLKVADWLATGKLGKPDLPAAQLWRMRASKQQEYDAKPIVSLADSIRARVSDRPN
ncbi:MAG TPA: hypothetical protein V6C89_04300 [Drouetiella sp.]